MKSSNHLNRRTVLKLATGAAAAAVSVPVERLLAATNDDGFIDVRRPPDSITVVMDDGSVDATKQGADRWHAAGAEVRTAAGRRALRVTLSAPKTAVKQVRLRWRESTTAWKRVLGDHWERTYGDVSWRPSDAQRTDPWYLLAYTDFGTHGFGVCTQPGAFCGWTHDADGLTLVCDVRSGGVGVQLGDRVLNVCNVTARRGRKDESPFAAACAFCKSMCPGPRLADHVVYGCNDWYYAYGHNTPENLLVDAKLLSELASNPDNRPYCVIDDGWQTQERTDGGPWSAARASFGSMADLAASMAKCGVRPGIWMRPLIDAAKAWPAEWRLKHNPAILDPTRTEVKETVANDIRRLCTWGYRLIKHDYSTFDILGAWGKDMAGGLVTADGWSFASRTRTTAEVISDLYRVIREAAGDGVVLGCNTISHLSAGVFELNRIGDDTSGREWARIPKMGVNTLAFRGPQQGAFYGADPDCCPVTTHLEWRRARQWLDLVSRSGTSLFVSVERAALTRDARRALQNALAAASRPLPVAEPLDWMTTATPSEWKLDGEQVRYDWS